MTRKDYEATAAAFRAEQPDETEDPKILWLRLRCAMADLFEVDNPRFDRVRFYMACKHIVE